MLLLVNMLLAQRKRRQAALISTLRAHSPAHTQHHLALASTKPKVLPAAPAMNFFGGSSQPAAPAAPASGPSPLELAHTEMEMYTDLFNRMGDMCFQKCISGFKEADLNIGEMSCTDRCVGKYLEVHDKVCAQIAKAEAKLQAEAAAQQ